MPRPALSEFRYRKKCLALDGTPYGAARHDHDRGRTDGTPERLPAPGVDGLELLSLAVDGAALGRAVLFGQVAEWQLGPHLAMDRE